MPVGNMETFIKMKWHVKLLGAESASCQDINKPLLKMLELSFKECCQSVLASDEFMSSCLLRRACIGVAFCKTAESIASGVRFTCPTLDVRSRLHLPHVSARAEDGPKRGHGVQDEVQRKKLDAALEERQLRKLAAAQAEDQERARQWRLVKGGPQPRPPTLPTPRVWVWRGGRV